jgi:hypothetical protein
MIKVIVNKNKVSKKVCFLHSKNESLNKLRLINIQSSNIYLIWLNLKFIKLRFCFFIHLEEFSIFFTNNTKFSMSRMFFTILIFVKFKSLLSIEWRVIVKFTFRKRRAKLNLVQFELIILNLKIFGAFNLPELSEVWNYFRYWKKALMIFCSNKSNKNFLNLFYQLSVMLFVVLNFHFIMWMLKDRLQMNQTKLDELLKMF